MTEADILGLVRPAVSSQRAYHVGGTIDPPVKLNQNESPYDLPDDLRGEILDAFGRIAFNRYPTEQPDSLAAALGEREGHPAEGILVGNGSNELTYTLGLSFVEPGVQVVLPRPMFALYTTMVRIHGGTVVDVPPRGDLSFDVDGIIRAMRVTGAAMTVACTPNNPTGLALTPDDLERIVRAAPGLVVIDEAYVEFNPHGSAMDLLRRYPNVILLRTLSKAFGLAGLRVGYLVGRPALIRELLKARLPFMIDRFAQAVAQAVLDHPDLVDRRIREIRSSISSLTAALSSTPGVEVLPSATNFVLFRTARPAAELMNALARRGVLVRDMGGYPDLKGWLRVSAGLESENRAFLEALNRSLDEVPRDPEGAET